MAKVTALGWGAKGTNILDPEYRAELEEKAKRDNANKARREKRAEDKKAEEKKARAEKRAAKKEAASSPGISSIKSFSKPEPLPKQSEADDPKPAPTAVSPLKKDHEGNSIAGSTAGSGKDEK